jgi:hypothetical protein
MPGSLRLFQPGQQNWFQGNHVVVGQGQGFEPANLTKNALKETKSLPSYKPARLKMIIKYFGLISKLSSFRFAVYAKSQL